jgi:hypothetical protein
MLRQSTTKRLGYRPEFLRKEDADKVYGSLNSFAGQIVKRTESSAIQEKKIY